MATGLALTIFGTGLSGLIGEPFVGALLTGFMVPVPLLADLPVVGPLLFQHDFLAYLSVVSLVVVALFLKRSRAGLICVLSAATTTRRMHLAILCVRFD